MTLTAENSLLIGSLLLFVSLLAGKTSYRFGVPALVLFLCVGMLAGSEGIGGIYFDNPNIAQFIGIIALNVILFSGGLDTDWKAIKPVLGPGIMLSTVGVFITAGLVGAFVWLVTDFSIYEGLLLGSIVSSTDSAAVFSILRSKSLALKNNLRPMLELESGSNDPMAYVLTIICTGLVVNQDAGMSHMLPLLIKQMFLGGVLGFIFGKAGVWIINKIDLEYEALYPTLVLAIAYFSFSMTDFLGGNGFLAVYLAAVFIGNQEFVHKKKIFKTFDGYAWLMQIVLFLTLGLLVFPSEIVPVIGTGLFISAFMILVGRPIAVFLSLLPFKMQVRSTAFVSWVGLRGAVPIVFATYPLIAGAEKAPMIFNIVFFISLTSVVVQGTSLPLVAKWLNLTLPEKAKARTESDLLDSMDKMKSVFKIVSIPADSDCVGKKIVELGLPKTTLISIIQRDKKYIPPGGSTVIEAGDRLFLLSESDAIVDEVNDVLGLKMEAVKKA